jgi:hypothetical protein
MALDVILSYTSESLSEEIYSGTYTDQTVYGGSNPVRSQFANYIGISKMNSDGTVDYAVEVDTYDPETASNYIFDIEKDGWYRVYYAVVPVYDNATSYNQYDVVYLSGVVYRALVTTVGNTPPNNSYWEVITDPAGLVGNVDSVTESGNLPYTIQQDIIYPFAKTCYGDLTEQADCNCNCDRSEKTLAYEQAGVFVDQLDVCNQRQKYPSGERIAVAAAEFCSDNDCGC